MGAKTESMLKLMELGVNTPVFEVLSSSQAVMEFIEKGAKWDKFSIRTDNKKGLALYKKWGLPFFPNRTWGETVDVLEGELLQLVDKNLDIIVAEGINPEDSLVSGRYLRDFKGDIVDYVLGPSTGRDVEAGVPKQWNPSYSANPPLPEITKVADYAKSPSFLRVFRVPFVLEFSIYPYPIGKLRDKLIFWEVIEVHE